MKKVIYEVTQDNAVTIANLLFEKFKELNDPKADRFLSVEEVADFIGYKKTSIYGLVKKNKIPYYKNGKLYFLRSEILEWMTRGKEANLSFKMNASEYILKNSMH